MDKRALITAVLAALDQEIETLTASANATREGVVHEESRVENDKDTRGLEASYLARGQAKRVHETVEAAARVRHMHVRDFDEDTPISLSALVELEGDRGTRHVLLVPAGGGLEVKHDDVAVQLLTPATPVGRALIGKVVDDDVEVRVAGQPTVYSVVAVW